MKGKFYGKLILAELLVYVFGDSCDYCRDHDRDHDIENDNFRGFDDNRDLSDDFSRIIAFMLIIRFNSI